MATTPEGMVKKQVRAVLEDFGCWYYMPVPGGYGAPTLDFHAAINGVFFLIETKAPGKKPTPRQELDLQTAQEKGIKTFVIDGPEGCLQLRKWLLGHHLWGPRDLHLRPEHPEQAY